MAEELELTQISFPPAQAEEISAMLMQRAIPPDARRAAIFFLLHNLSYNGLGTEFAALDRDWDRFQHQITRCARILQHIPMENRSYKEILSKYDATDTVFTVTHRILVQKSMVYLFTGRIIRNCMICWSREKAL